MKTLNIFLVAFFTLGLTACGGSSGESTASNNTGNSGNGGTELDRCIEQAILNGAKTGAEALAICLPGGSGSTGGNGNNNNGSSGENSTDDGNTAIQYQSILVKGMSMLPANTILSLATSPTQAQLIAGLVICDNSVVTPNKFKNGLVKKTTTIFGYGWVGDSRYAGYHNVEIDVRDDNCLVQGASATHEFPSMFQNEGTNTIYRKGKVAHIDMISTLAMARLMGTRSYSIIEDILQGQDQREFSNFTDHMHKGHFDTYRNELPSNEEYEAAEQAIIDEIKSTPEYVAASTEIDSVIANSPFWDDLLDAYNNLAERAKLLAALYEIKQACGASCSDDANSITLYSEGADLKTIYSL